MDKIVIERNGVRHRLVKSEGLFFKCEKCSLSDICKKGCIRLCARFRDDICHFEREV